MNRQDIEKLLGGYATGTLTPEEREALFTAALEDQTLFDALAREEPLRELLQDPIAKARLRAALQETKVPWYHARLRPALLAVAIAGIAVVAVVVERQSARRPELASARLPKPVMPEPVPSPLPRALEKKAVPPLPASPVAVTEPAGVTAETPAVRTEPVLQARVTEAVRVTAPQDAAQLFSATSLRPAFRANLLRSDQEGRGPGRAATAPVADALAIAPAAHLGVRYAVLRRLPDGGFGEVSPGQELDAADEVVVRLEANDDAYLTVLEHASDGPWRPIASDRIARLQPYTVPRTGALRFETAGPIELFVQISRQPFSADDRAPTPGGDQVFGTRGTERLTYVVSTATDAAAQRVGFAITLRQK